MQAFLARRLTVTVLVVAGTTLIVFILTRVVPGDPIRTMLAAAQVADPNLVERYRRDFGLDQPLPIQYARWVWNLANGDLGRSIESREAVRTILGRAFAATFVLALAGMVLAVVTGVALGATGALLAVRRPHSIVARGIGLAPLALIT